MLEHWPFWSAYIATGTLLVLLAWLGSRRRKLNPRRFADGGVPAACGSCGYDLTGLPGTTCPECGSDLELVGRISPQFRRWAAVPVTARLIVWTIMLAVLGGTWSYVAVYKSLLPRQQRFRAEARWGVHAPVGSSDYPRYTPLWIHARAEFTRKLRPDDWTLSQGNAIPPDEGTRWIEAAVEVGTMDPPAIRDDRPDYSDTQSQTDLLYLKPGDGGRLVVETFSPDQPEVRRPPITATSALVSTIHEIGYDGRAGSAEAIVEALSPEFERFLRYGSVPTRLDGARWYTGPVTVTRVDAARLDLTGILAVITFWTALWLQGLPFILRRRPLSIRGVEAAPETATTPVVS